MILEKNRDEWVDFFKDSNICFTPVLNMEEMTKHPHIKEREMITTLENFKDSGKDLNITGVPIKFSEKMSEVKCVFSEVGEDNHKYLEDIGYTTEQIEKLIKDNVI